MLEYEFMRNALFAISIVTPLFGLVGTMIVNNKMAFFSDALGHSAITGIAIGAILGVTNPTVSMILFAVVFALLLNKIKDIKSSSRDTIISVFSSTAIAIGLVLLSQNGNFSKFSNYLIGDILSIVPEEIYLILAVAIIVFVFWILLFNKLLAVSVNPTLAKSKKISIKMIENAFIVIIAIIVMMAIKWVGILIINSLLILPAASSRNISRNMRQYHIWAVVFAIISGVVGLIASYYAKVATGPTIAIVASIIFFITYFMRKKSED